MTQYDIPISMRGGFTSSQDAAAHRNVVHKLQDWVDTAASVSASLKEADKVDITSSTSDLYQDLAPGKGKVVMLSQPEGSPVIGLELDYDPADGTTKRLNIDMGDTKLTQVGQTFRFQEPKSTTYFQVDPKLGTFTVLDPQHDVPAIFNGADAAKLTGGIPQLHAPIVIF